MTKSELNEILELHKKWSNGATDGRQACLGGADLHGVDLHGAYLWGARLRGVNLRNADLRGADLRGACLQRADLQYADLRYADLQDAYLQEACLLGANLKEANFQKAYLHDVDLQNACLKGADFRGAILRRANFYEADLQGADFQNADLYNAKNIPLLPWTSIVPECGNFIGWKRVGEYIVKLKILDDAKRSNATGRKCRCSAAEVLEIQNLDGTKSDISRIHNNNFCGADYIVGEVVTPDSFDDDRWSECSNGIHFFITRQEAVDY